MILFAPLGDYKDKQLFTNMKIEQTTIRYDRKKLQAINPMFICAPWYDTYLHNCKLEELNIIEFNPINILITTVKVKKTGTLATIFHKPVGGVNPYVRFGYGPLKIF